MNKEISEQLRDIVMSISKSKKEITDDTNLIFDLGFDSVAMIELFSAVEDEFDIEFEFDDVDFEDIAIYKNFVNYVESIME